MKKLILSHRGALKKKYGSAGLAKVEAALLRMTAADATRGLTTVLEYVDVAPSLGSARVKNAANAKAVKKAVDLLFVHHGNPDYVMLLGAPDVIPHQPLDNPLPIGNGEDEDPDQIVPSDLPYACSHTASATIKDFLGPTRAVGRLPDVFGDSDATYLIELIDAAAKHQPMPAPKKRFALTAAVWVGATRGVTKQAFGTAAKPRVSPPGNAPVPKARLRAAPVHLVNCHGAPSDPTFYGDDDTDMPEALTSSNVLGNVPGGTVVAAECCYGAELYAPKGIAPAICNTYLGDGAVGFLGSTNVAYGAADANLENADVMCAEFLELVHGGASLGRALLEARLRFLKAVKPLSGMELKTIAQFLLLGDPSLRAVAAAAPTGNVAKAKSKAKGEAMILGLDVSNLIQKGMPEIARHMEHRAKLSRDGMEESAWADRHRMTVTRRAAGPSATKAKKSFAVPLLAETAKAVQWAYEWKSAAGDVLEGAVLAFLSRADGKARKTHASHARSKKTGSKTKGPKRVEVMVTKFLGGKQVSAARIARR